jgi:hypothetical protein
MRFGKWISFTFSHMLPMAWNMKSHFYERGQAGAVLEENEASGQAIKVRPPVSIIRKTI